MLLRCRTLLLYGRQVNDSLLFVDVISLRYIWDTSYPGRHTDISFFASQANSMRIHYLFLLLTVCLNYGMLPGTIFLFWLIGKKWKVVTGTHSYSAYGSVLWWIFRKEDSELRLWEPGTLVTPVVLKINEWTVNFSEIYKALLVLFFLIEVGRRISR